MEPPRSEPGENPGRSVLVAEDSAAVALLIRRTLERAGCRVETVGDGFAAVDAVEAASYDLIVLDLEMPGMGGLAAAEAIRSHERKIGRSKTPIVLLTASDDANLPARCKALGIDRYLPKSRESLLCLPDFVATPATRPAAGGAWQPDGGEMDGLLQAYLGEARDLVGTLGGLLREERFAEIASIAHRFHGSGATYGMAELSALGRELEGSARAKDREKTLECCARLHALLGPLDAS